MNCTQILEQVGCWKHADGSQENITIVREYGEGTTGIVLAKTHFIDASGNHITLAAGESITAGACSVCCGSVTYGNLNTTGNTIATITTAEGQSFDIKETVTTFTSDYTSTNGTKVGSYTNEDGTVVDVYVPVFKEQNRFYADPNGSNSTGNGANENPYLTATMAIAQLGQGDIAVINEGAYAETVTMGVQNTSLTGASGAYGSLTQLTALNVTASGTSVRIADITFTGAVSHTGTSPMYLNNVTVNGQLNATSAVYREIRQSSLQNGTHTISAGTTLVESSKVGNMTFSGAGTIALLRDVVVDVGECITIGAGVVYSVTNVTGCVNINAAAIPAETAAIAAGYTATQAEAGATTAFNNLRITNPDTEASPTRVLTYDTATGEVEVSTLAAVNVLTVLGTPTWDAATSTLQIPYTDEAGNTTTTSTQVTIPVGDKYLTTSTDCVDIVPSSGNVTFNVSPNLSYIPEQDVIMYASAGNHMHGTVVSYNSTTGALVVHIDQKTGSGNYCSWQINLDAIGVAAETLTTVTNTLASATYRERVATYTNEAGTTVDVYATAPVDALTTTQTTPTATGNTTNLNTIFKDSSNNAWFVDSNGDAVALGSASSPESVTYGTAAPSASAVSGDRYFRTGDGTRTGEMLEEYIYDGTGWTLLGHNRENFITALTPQYYSSGGAWTSARANTTSTVADAVLVTYANGTTERLRNGKFTWTGHGLTVGAQYYLDKNTAGALTTTVPTGTEISQAVLFVHDSNTIEVNLQEAVEATVPLTTVGTQTTRFVNRGVDVTMDNLKIQVPTSGTTLQIGAVSGSFNFTGTTTVDWQTGANASFHQLRSSTATTTYQTIDTSSWALSNMGARQTFDFIDTTNLRRYRVTYIVNGSYLNNAITIERLA